MKGLRILDDIRWHDKWSAEIGQRLNIRDSSNDFYVFDPMHGRDDILSVLKDVPPELYQIVDVTEAPEEDCDFYADSGQCYRRTQ